MLYTMFLKVIRRCLIPAAAVVAEATVNAPVKNEEERLCRPSELPIYIPEATQESATVFKEQEIPGFIEDAFRNVRLTLTKYNEELQAYKKVGLDQFEKSRENVEWVVSYLQEENNTLPKAGAIGIGALTGLIFGLRGGFFKRTLYATTGAVGMAALCYPKEAAVYTQIGLTETKKYATIAYNFIYGDEKKPEPVSAAAEKVNKLKVEKSDLKDPLEIVTESHNIALSKSCHCPVGACLGHPEESLPNQSPRPAEGAKDPNVMPS